MSLNRQVSAERLHIGFFGMRNAGKSSVVNAVTGQKISIVSDVEGTTTDPVRKTMEILPLGPVVIIDTPGIDDEGELGLMRVKRTKDVLKQTDIAVLVVDSAKGPGKHDRELIEEFEAGKIPYVTVYNKNDVSGISRAKKDNEVDVSCVTGEGIEKLKNLIASAMKEGTSTERELLDGVVKSGDTVLLVTPIDSAAPKGRLILPQQQTVRSVLDLGAKAVVVKESELEQAMGMLKNPPDIVITDSQVFEYVSRIVPESVKLTSFSILFARYKGDLKTLLEGADKIDSLKDGDRVLISEGCTHKRQCGDIGTVKLPAFLKKYTGADLVFDHSSGNEFTDTARDYSLIIHCGGCMLTEKQMKSRIADAVEAGVPITNYGVAIAKMKGILKRSTEFLDC